MKKKKDDLNDQELLILEMWSQGASGTEIGKQIGKTRSAVLGKLNRLRMKGLVGYKVSKQRIEAQKVKLGIKTKPKKLAPVSLPRKKGSFVFEKSSKKAQPPTFIEPTPSKDGKPVKFMQLHNSMCKYVVSGVKAADFMFCGQPSVKKHYCEQHYKLCYVPYEKSKRSKENA